MPWELIYTSAQRGLISGQSGFCTVARTGDLRESLAQRIEQISSYHYVEYAGSAAPRRNPVISAYRLLDLRGTKFYVLSRLLPCGLDFTARTNHLAHHLIFTADELVCLPSPAAILLHWKGWRNVWQGEPRLLDRLPADSFSHLPPMTWPAVAWQQMTGDAGRAAGLLENDFCRGSYLLTAAGGEQFLLQLFVETLQLLNPAAKSAARAWQHPFTTFLQGEDVPADFHWRGCQPGTPAYEQAIQRAVTPLTLQAIRIPNNELARLAREGPRAAPVAPTSGPAAPLIHRKLTVRKPLEDFRPMAASRPAKAGPEGFNISINVKSLAGVGVAVVLLVVLLWTRHRWSRHSPTAPTQPPVAVAPKSPANLPAAAASTTSTTATNPVKPEAPVPAEKPAQLNRQPKRQETPLSQTEAKRELENGLLEVPTYLRVVPSLANGRLTLANIPPLVKVLQLFSHIDLRPSDVNTWCYLNDANAQAIFSGGWESYVKSDPNGHKLYVAGSGNFVPGSGFEFDYSSFADKPASGETVQLHTLFQSESLAAVASLALIFQPAGTGTTHAPAGFESFGLVVVNAGNPPSPLSLNKRFLQTNKATLEESFREPLRSRFNQLQVPAGSVWQLRPQLIISNLAGRKQMRDLYEALPPQVRPAPGSGLDFEGIIRAISVQWDANFKAADRLQQKIDAATAMDIPPVKWDLPVASLLGVTNTELLNFSAFLASRTNASPTSPLFLSYLELVNQAARSQQPWLRGWPDQSGWGDPAWEDTHFDVVLKQLQQLYALCVAHLPPPVAGKFTEGMATQNYFVAGWSSLSRDTVLAKWKEEKATTDDNVHRWLLLLQLMPDNLDRIAEVGLFLTTPNNPPLEIIRFTTERKRQP